MKKKILEQELINHVLVFKQFCDFVCSNSLNTTCPLPPQECFQSLSPSDSV